VDMVNVERGMHVDIANMERVKYVETVNAADKQ